MPMSDYGAILNYVAGNLSAVADFCIIACLVYGALYFLRGTRGSAVLSGIIFALITMSVISEKLHFEVLGRLLNNLWTIFTMAIIIIFQPELRRAFAQLGTVTKAFTHKNKTERRGVISMVVDAAVQMAKTRTGALIVFERNIGMQAIINSAVVLDAKVNPLLLRALFYPNSPLHDGAVIIKDDRIVAAHVILSLTQEASENSDRRVKGLGTRHHAALSITEETDAVAVVVSEESGIISVAYKGRLIRDFNEITLTDTLEDLMIRRDTIISNVKNVVMTKKAHSEPEVENAFSDGSTPPEEDV